MKATVMLSLWALLLCATTFAAGRERAGAPGLYFWIWWRNLGGKWQELIDFAAEQKMTGVVIWGLQGWKADPAQCRKVVEYAHARGVQVIHGLGLNGYEVGKHIVKTDPGLAAVVPEHLAKTKKGEWTRNAVFCPSKPKALRLLREALVAAASTGIDGFNFETADVDYITCHCPDCQARFQSQSETEHTNKPVEWPLFHLKYAADALVRTHPDLWLNCEFAMQRFGKKPYTDCDAILRMNREIDPRITVVWCEGTAPPDAIAKKLRAERENVGFYIRSGAIMGWEAKHVLGAKDMLPIARRLLALDPVCMMYRSWRPLDWWAVNMGVAAEALHKPNMADAELGAEIERFEAMRKPGGPYSFVKRVAPGNLIAPGTKAKLTVSSGDALRLVDGVAEAGDGIWRTERNSPAQAWAVAEWPEPMTVSRVRLFHQKDAEYRSLDYTVQHWSEGDWRDVAGMPITGNSTHGWVEHAFPPVATAKLRLLITRSRYGNRIAMGEWEVYAE